MGCDEVLGLLREREAACRAEAGRLRAEGERIAGLLVEREEELAELVTACRVVDGLYPDQAPAVRERPVGPVRIPAPRSEAGLSAREIAEQVPQVLARYAGPVRVKQVVEDLGLEATSSQIERVRHQLRKAVAEGVAAPTPGGLFTLARGTHAAHG